VGQLSHCPLQFGRPFHHLHLEFVAGFNRMTAKEATAHRPNVIG
jgi:hypothetical protein